MYVDMLCVRQIKSHVTPLFNIISCVILLEIANKNFTVMRVKFYEENLRRLNLNPYIHT